MCCFFVAEVIISGWSGNAELEYLLYKLMFVL